MKSALIIGALFLLTALSAFFDAKGFVYAAQAWRDGALIPATAFRAVVFFLGGVSVYISTIGLQQRLGVHSAALQTLFWFAMTIIGIALLDGRSFRDRRRPRCAPTLVVRLKHLDRFVRRTPDQATADVRIAWRTRLRHDQQIASACGGNVGHTFPLRICVPPLYGSEVEPRRLVPCEPLESQRPAAQIAVDQPRGRIRSGCE